MEDNDDGWSKQLLGCEKVQGKFLIYQKLLLCTVCTTAAVGSVSLEQGMASDTAYCFLPEGTTQPRQTGCYLCKTLSLTFTDGEVTEQQGNNVAKRPCSSGAQGIRQPFLPSPWLSLHTGALTLPEIITDFQDLEISFQKPIVLLG